MDSHWIGAGLAVDGHQIGMNCHWIGIGLTTDWRQVGTDWRWIATGLRSDRHWNWLRIDIGLGWICYGLALD